METIRLGTDTASELVSACERSSAVLQAGGVVALPTETVYGLAADALNTEAVLKIFAAKERPFFDPLIVHLPSNEWLSKVTEIADVDRSLVDCLIARFWPGPLTLVLPRTDSIPDVVCAGLPTVAVRISAHPVFSAVMQEFGRPLAAPSANRFGRISPTTADHVFSELSGRIPVIVDAGATSHGVESTIVMVRENMLTILRDGPVTREQLAEFGTVHSSSATEDPIAPGQLKSHYAPGTPLKIIDRTRETNRSDEMHTKRALLAWNSAPPKNNFHHAEVLSERSDLVEAAATLFAKLRILDESGADVIFAESVPEQGLGVAIMDRLRKAAHG